MEFMFVLFTCGLPAGLRADCEVGENWPIMKEDVFGRCFDASVGVWRRLVGMKPVVVTVGMLLDVCIDEAMDAFDAPAGFETAEPGRGSLESLFPAGLQIMISMTLMDCHRSLLCELRSAKLLCWPSIAKHVAKKGGAPQGPNWARYCSMDSRMRAHGDSAELSNALTHRNNTLKT